MDKKTINRFWIKVDRFGACWEWTAGCFKRGYGAFNYGDRKPGYAHRFSYELHYGPIPDGAVVMHVCDNPKCVRPTHLVLGTQSANMADRHHKGRDCRGEDVHFATIDAETARAIYQTDGPAKDVAEKFNTTPDIVYHIRCGNTWSWATGHRKRSAA